MLTNTKTFGSRLFQRLSIVTLSFALILSSIPSTVSAADGNLDSTFNTNIGAGLNNYVRDIAVQPDGKIIAVGLFATFNGTSSPRIVRLNSDGTQDTSFDTGGIGFNNYARHIELLSNGQMYVSGIFSAYNGVSAGRIIKLNSNGTVDSSFNVGVGFAPSVSQTAIVIQSDDKVVAVGQNTSYQSTGIGYIARLNTDATLDTTFNSGNAGFNNRPNTMKLLSGDKLIIGGEFTTYNGSSYPRMIRLNADGSVDGTFNPGTGFNSSVYDIEVQADGKYVVTGLFTSYNGTSANGIIRLNSDGTVDGTFNSGTGFTGQVEDSVIQTDGKIFVGGNFTAYNGTSINRLIRLNTDGSIDSSFTVGTGFNDYILGPSMTLDADSNLLVGGLFTTYDGVSVGRIARITSSVAAPPATPSAPDLDNTSDTGFSNSDNITNDSTPTFTGSASSTAVISLYQSGSFVASTTADGSGNYSITVPTPLSTNQNYTYTVVQTVSSLSSATSTSLIVNFDSTAPSVTLNSTTPSSNSLTVSWSTDESATSTLFYGSSVVTDNHIQLNTPATSHSTTASALTASTAYLYKISAMDLAGNATTTSEFTATTTSESSGGGNQSNSNNGYATLTAKSAGYGSGYSPVLTTNEQSIKNPEEICQPYLLKDLKMGQTNDTEEVRKLQYFLNKYENEKLQASGVFDIATENAVRRFQQKYAKHVLFPWGLTSPTGFVYKTTKAKINAMMCAQVYGCPYFKEYHKVGSNSTDMQKVKSFLNILNPQANLNTKSTVYDAATRVQVIDFQSRYKDTVLKPWGLTSPTSYWYKTSRASAHEIMGCTERI